MNSGDQMLPFYESWRARYPRTFTAPLTVRPDRTDGYHIESGVENGVPWTSALAGYGPIMSGQATHEVMGHMLRRILGDGVWDSFWLARFGRCAQVPKLADHLLDPLVLKGVWAYLPIEMWAEAARIAFDPDSPIDANTIDRGDRSMDWGCDVDGPKMRAWFDKLLGGGTTVTPTPFSLQIIDVRDNLPLMPDREVGRAAKSSVTVHWNGPPIPAGIDPLALIIADANFHISKDWSPEPGVQGGDGIMYHFLIAPDGRVFKTRDDDAVLWHCGAEIGNWFSYAVQVMVGGDSTGVGDPVTAEQYASLAQLIAHLGLDDVKPHKIWSGTTCPGLELTDWVNRQAWKEDDMFSEDDRRMLKRVYDHLEAYEPLVWTKRLQQWLAKALRSFNPNTDLSGPDVESGQPFK